MLVTPERLESFLRESSREYPYNEIFGTRKQLYVRWVLMKRARRVQSTAIGTDWEALPSSMFDADTMTYLLVSRQALPATRDMAKILDTMESWGRGVSDMWYLRTVDYLGFLCEEKHELGCQQLMRHCIAFRVNTLLVEEAFAKMTITLDQYDALLDNFECFFDDSYCYSTKCFRELCAGSFFFIRESVDAILEVNGNSAAGAVESDSSSLPATVVSVVSSSWSPC